MCVCITFLTLACFYITSTFAENVSNISDNLAVEATVDTISILTSLAPETKSKTEKRDSSDQIGTTIYTLKEDEHFRPITSETYHHQLQPQIQQLVSSPSPSTFQPTTVRYVAEEAAPQIYYDRPPNVVRDVSHVVPTTNNGKLSNDVGGGGIHYGTPSHVYRGPFREPYELGLEQAHPQPQPQTQQQQELKLEQQQKLQQQQRQQIQFNQQQQQYAQTVKASPNLSYVSPPSDSGFIPLEGPLQHHPPYHYRQQQAQPNIPFPQSNEQQKQQQQQYSPYQRQFQQQPQHASIQKQSLPQQQLQHHQYQQPGRQQINYIIAIPLSYVRQLQHQFASQRESAPASASPTPQNQQQSPSLVPLQIPHSHLPLLLVLQPISSGSGASSSGSSLNHDSYRLQSPIHYALQAPTPSNSELNSNPQAVLALASQQLPFPMDLVLTAAPVRPRQTIYPSSQLLYVQPQLIRQIPQQQLQLQVKQHQNLPRYVQKQDDQRPQVEGRNTQQKLQQQPRAQQNEHPRVTVFVPKPTVKHVLVPSQSAAPPSSPPTESIPTKATSSHTPPQVFFYNPAYVQPPPLEQHTLPPSPYSNYIQAQLRSGLHAAPLVKLAPFTPQYYPAHNTVGTPPNILVSKVPLQLQQPPHQQSAALPAMVGRPAFYMATQDILNGGGLPYFMHPAGVHYGTHLYNPGIPLGVSPKLLESVVSTDAGGQRHRQQQQQPQQQPQRLGSTAKNGINDDNNADIKYSEVA
ncbi:uncharacterized protein [Eurosta solidaginis]|uniref:uncharacterized protein isoform X2 n=1 Tax=Eurosta solidaginis TaxID=178769 RepID=UPI00353173B7